MRRAKKTFGFVVDEKSKRTTIREAQGDLAVSFAG
jgi:hypothetical protein